METIAALQLPFQFDPVRLAADVESAAAIAGWERHFNEADYHGEWSGIALRGNSRSILTLYSDPSRPDGFFDFPPLAACAYTRETLASFHCRVDGVRFLKLAPGARIREHRDAHLAFEYGEVRIHVPVLTNADIELTIGGKPFILNPGECWYLNTDLPHAVLNRGTTDRIHLVIDAVVNDWLREVFARSGYAPQ